MINKSCYVCGSFEHLQYDCDQRVVKPVKNNTRRVNHKNFSNRFTYPYPKRIFVPQAVLTRSGKFNTAGVSVTTAVRPINTVCSKSTVNHPRLISNAFKRGHSQVITPFNKYSAYKKTMFNNEVNDVKASGCWVWRPKQNVTDHVSKQNSASLTLKRFDYTDVQGSGEAKLKLKELMELCTKLSDKVLDLEKTKSAQAKELAYLKKRVKKLERKRRSKTPGMNLFKIGTSRRKSLCEDDASKQGRNLKQRRAEKKIINQSSKEESNMILSDLSSHSTRSEEMLGYILLVKIKLLIKKLND
nr:retrotransposon Orf1 [Tanacetum cinerariifolium]